MPKIDCPHCGAHLTYPADKAGRRARCPKCKTSTRLPAADNPPPASGPPAWAGSVTIQDGHDRTGLAVAADGRSLVTADDETHATLWDPASGRPVRTFSSQPPHCLCVALSPDDRYVLAGGGTARGDQPQPLGLWETATGKPGRQFVGHTLAVTSVAFLPDGRTAISGSRDCTLRLWDVATGTQLAELVAPRTSLTYKGQGDRGHEYYMPAPVTGIRCSPDGRFCTAADANHLVRLWHLRDGSIVHVKEQQRGASAFTRDGRHVITAGVDGRFRVWGVETGEDEREFGSRVPCVHSIDTTPDGRHFVYGGGESGSVYLADLTSGDVVRSFDTGGNGVRVVRVASTGAALAAITDRVVRVWTLTK